MKEITNVVAGLDVGNGYVKGLAVGTNNGAICVQNAMEVDIPSCVATVANPIDVPVIGEEAIAEEIKDIFNRGNITIQSPLVSGRYKYRLYTGNRALNSGESVSAFEIAANKPKADQQMSAVLALSMTAGAALRAHYEANGELPDAMHIKAVVAMALPIQDYKTRKSRFVAGFKQDRHLVTFFNFERPISIDIEILDVPILAEGASAQIAIVSKGEVFIKALMQKCRDNGMALDGIEAADILAATNTSGSDIGEGTVNEPVFLQQPGNAYGSFNTDFSSTIYRGFGTVLENCLEPLREICPFDTRKKLADFLQNTPGMKKKLLLPKIMPIVEAESAILVDDIVHSFEQKMTSSGGKIEVHYVYGGGATPLQKQLYPKLIQEGQRFNVPILYLDSKYSRLLNRDGLYQLAARKAVALGVLQSA